MENSLFKMENREMNNVRKPASNEHPSQVYVYLQNISLQVITNLGIKRNLDLEMAKMGLLYCICC